MYSAYKVSHDCVMCNHPNEFETCLYILSSDAETFFEKNKKTNSNLGALKKKGLKNIT